MISYNLPYFPIKNDKAQHLIKLQRKYLSKKLIREKINAESNNFQFKTEKNNQISSYIQKNGSKDININPVIIKITGNNINNNTYHREGKKEKKISNFNSKIDKNIKLINSCLKNELDQKISLIQKKGLDDGDDVNFQSKDQIIGELQNNDGALKLNEKKNNL